MRTYRYGLPLILLVMACPETNKKENINAAVDGILADSNDAKISDSLSTDNAYDAFNADSPKDTYLGTLNNDVNEAVPTEDNDFKFDAVDSDIVEVFDAGQEVFDDGAAAVIAPPEDVINIDFVWNQDSVDIQKVPETFVSDLLHDSFADILLFDAFIDIHESLSFFDTADASKLDGNDSSIISDSFSSAADLLIIPDGAVIKEISGFNFCGEQTICNEGFVCVDNLLCCPLNMTQNCNGQCFPENCLCIAENDFTLCVPDNMDYCGNGVSCSKDECYFAQDLDSHICISDDKYYCGNGIICVKDEEYCHQEGDNYYCVPNGKIFCSKNLFCDKESEYCNNEICVPKDNQLCESGIQCNKDEVCGVNHCCKEEQPTECGDGCCYPDSQCVDCGNGPTCLPKEWECCNGAVCTTGKTCASDGLPVCYPENGDYCGNGMWCDPGKVCASEGAEITCCSQEYPKLCGHSCCPDYYNCVDTVFGAKCIPPNTEPCGNDWCISDEYCFDEDLSICVKEGSEPCDDGHVCESGTYCAGSTCCPIFDPIQNCGNLCCPLSGWKCINSGEACIPQDTEYIGNGQYCPIGKSYNKENNNCDPVKWKPCGIGPACPPDMACAVDGNNKKCCGLGQTVLCGDACCYDGYQCIHDGEKDICIPALADYCGDKNLNEWCPAGTWCGDKGKNCIPDTGMECDEGSFCTSGMKCTNSNPACCSWNAPIPCETKCCAIGYECMTLESGTKKCCENDSVVCGEDCCLSGYECKTWDNGEKQCCLKGANNCSDFCCPSGEDCYMLNGKATCVPPNMQVCISMDMGDVMCDKNISFCEQDGFCMPNEYKGQEYSYCGCGETCPEDKACGGLCTSTVCCDKEDAQACSISECFSNDIQPTSYSENDYTNTYCSFHYIGYWDADSKIDTIKECAENKCKKDMDCKFIADQYGNGSWGKICCTYDKITPVGCLKGCVTPGHFCYDIPTSNSDDAYLNPIESGLLPQNIPNVGGDCNELGWLLFISLGFVDGYPVFHPAGFSENYKNGVYHAENDKDNWIKADPGEEVLVVEAAWIIDAMEGLDCPHGPYGNLYWLIHNKYALPANLDKIASLQFKWNSEYGYNTKYFRGLFQGGPAWSFCICAGLGFIGLCWEKCWDSFDGKTTDVDQEWISYSYMRYTPGKAVLHKWEKNQDSVYLTLRESDGEDEDPTRKDDYMGFVLISREETKNLNGVWVPLHKYEHVKEDDDPNNDNDLVYFDGMAGSPYYKTDKVAGWLLLRTMVW